MAVGWMNKGMSSGSGANWGKGLSSNNWVGRPTPWMYNGMGNMVRDNSALTGLQQRVAAPAPAAPQQTGGGFSTYAAPTSPMFSSQQQLQARNQILGDSATAGNTEGLMHAMDRPGVSRSAGTMSRALAQRGAAHFTGQQQAADAGLNMNLANARFATAQQQAAFNPALAMAQINSQNQYQQNMSNLENASLLAQILGLS